MLAIFIFKTSSLAASKLFICLVHIYCKSNRSKFFLKADGLRGVVLTRSVNTHKYLMAVRLKCAISLLEGVTDLDKKESSCIFLVVKKKNKQNLPFYTNLERRIIGFI